MRAVGARAAWRAGQDLHVGFRRGQGGCRAEGAAACPLSASRCGGWARAAGRACGPNQGRVGHSISGIQAMTLRNGCPKWGGTLPTLMPSAASRPASQAAHNASTVRTCRLRAGDARCAALALRVGAGEEQHAEVADDAGHQADANHPAAGVQVACGRAGVGGVGGRWTNVLWADIHSDVPYCTQSKEEQLWEPLVCVQLSD